jgi:hypothetical protein
MDKKFESLKSETEHILDGPDKKAMLEILERIEREDKEIEASVLRDRKRDRYEKIFLLVIGSFLAYFPISAIFTGKIYNIFVEESNYVYWNSNPPLFAFLVVYYGLTACIFFGAVIMTYFQRRKRITPQMRAELDHFLEKEITLLNRSKGLPSPGPYGTKVPHWLVAFVIGSVLWAMFYGAAKNL